MTYEEVDLWVRSQDLIYNRVSIINQCLGARYDTALDNPCVVRHVGSCYIAYLFDCEFARWKIYDQVSTDGALARLEAYSDGLWYTLRSGKLAVV